MRAYQFALATVVASLPAAASAHDAPSGWTYDATCCSSTDCREISSANLTEGPDGYLIDISNETVPYGDKRLKDSPDGHVHWCTVGGRNDGRTICLYIPPRGF